MKYTPSEFGRLVLNKYRKTIVIFCLIYLVGLITHLYMFTNKFFNFFELGNIFADMSFTQGDTIAQGRWFLPIGSNLFTSYSIPLVNGVLSLFYVTLSAMLIIDLLKISSGLYSVLFGLCFVTFPGYACILAYGVNSDAINLAILLCTFGGWIFYNTKGIKRYILPAVFIAPGLAIYQTYLSIPIATVFCILFIGAAQGRTELKQFFIKVGQALIMLALGFILYYVVLKLSCVMTGVSLTDYHGVDSMTEFTPKGIVKGFVFSYIYFLLYFFTTEYIYSPFLVVMNLLGAAAFIMLAVGFILKRKGSGDKLSAIALIGLLAFLPLGINATPFLMADRVGAGVDRYMIPSLMLLWALLLKLMDLREAEGENLLFNTRIISWLGTVSAFCACISAGIICNQAYHKMEAGTNATAMYFNRIAAHLEVMEEYQSGYPIYFANSNPLMSSTYDVEQPAYEALKNMPGMGIFPNYNERGVAKYFRYYLHMPIPEITDGEKEAINASTEFKKMLPYPEKSSIQIINDTIVVKLTEKEEE